MEDRFCNVTLGYDPNLIRSSESTFNFTVESQNTQLLFLSNVEIYHLIKMIFRILSFIALAIFIVSLPHKLIGAELMTSFQTVFLSYYLY